MENDKSQPLAIVGMGFRLPGEARSEEGFWNMLSEARCARTKVPADRYNIDGFYHPSPDRQGAIITKESCFLSQDVGLFDAPFFSITANEADAMDPQHRMLLETTYEAFENAGIPITSLAGSRTACYVGSFGHDYEMLSGVDMYEQSMYQATGSGNSMMANRISWFYDLRGPSFVIDTACSSSMLALHEACRELYSGNSTMAIAAGASLILQPEAWRPLTAQRFLNPDGACHAFDSQANGYGRGEGFGAVILKPLADALRDNDVIRAVIRGIGTNQDGRTPAITVPNPEAQMDLIRETYERAGLDYRQTGYFEAHGTGTAVGDPMEVLAVGKTIGASKGEDDLPLLIGSVKSNVGHLEGTSGIAGVIKTVLALERGAIPAVAEFKSVNERLRMADWNLEVPTRLTPSPTDGLRRASINSFGYGGSNAHVIIDDAMNYLKDRGLVGNHNTLKAPSRPGSPSSDGSDSGLSIPQTPPENDAAPQKKIFVFTSPEKEGLGRLAETYSTFFSSAKYSKGEKSQAQQLEVMSRLAYTLSERRTMFDWRSFVVADSLHGLQSALENTAPKPARSAKDAACAFIFTGQGAQWFAMGRELQANAVFRNSVQETDAYLGSLGCTWSVLEELGRDKGSSRITDPELSQPLCTILQVALVNVLKYWGVTPKSVAGHSSGEISAAYAAGVFSQEDAWKIAYYRGLRSAAISIITPDRKGSMLAAALSEEAAQKYIDSINGVDEGIIVVACINSPNSVTISGDESAISKAKELLDVDGVWCRKLQVKTAYHSPHMQVIADQYLADIKNITVEASSSDVAIFSSVTGTEILAKDMGPEYWIKNLVSPVKFSDALTALVQPRDNRRKRRGAADVDAVVELGPHAALQGPIKEILVAASQAYATSVAYVPILRRGSNALDSALEAVGKLWSSGFNFDMSRVNSGEADTPQVQPLVNLPPYPFNHSRRYWFESRSVRWTHDHGKPRTDLLGVPASTTSSITPTWRNWISPSETPWLMHHRVHKLIMMPGSVYLSMVLEACREIADPNKTVEGYELRDVFWHRPIVFDSQEARVETILQLSQHHHGTKAMWSTWTRFSISVLEGTREAVEHCTGLAQIKYTTRPGEVDKGIEATKEWDAYKRKYEGIKAKPSISLSVKSTYEKLKVIGLDFGPTFQNLTSMNAGNKYGHCEVTVPDTAATMPESFEYPVPIHPVTIDAAFQMMICARQGNKNEEIMLPSAIESLYVSAVTPTEPGSVLTGFVVREPRTHMSHNGTVVLSDRSWDKPLFILRNFIISAAPTAKSIFKARGPYGHLDWVRDITHSQIPQHQPIAAQDEAILDARRNDRVATRLIQDVLNKEDLPEVHDSTNELAVAAQAKYRSWMRSTHSLHNTEATIDSTLQAINTVGKNLANILIAETEAPIINDEFISKFAAESLGRSFADDFVAELLDNAGFINPNMEILEIGTGFCARRVLKYLVSSDTNRLRAYTLTTRDQVSLDLARESLGDMQSDVLESMMLNIEEDIESQGFEARKFDYIILDDLTLSIPSLSSALQNVKTLLKPGGRLVILAITAAQLRTAFVLGSTSRWWRDHDGSTNDLNSMRLDETQWSKLLKETGFDGVDLVAHDSEDPNVHQISVMTSSISEKPELNGTKTILLCPHTMPEDISQLVSNCEENLVQSGVEVERATWDATPNITDKSIISFLELDSCVLTNLQESLYLAIKSMALESEGMLWLTRSGQISGEALPGFAVATGVFRSIRAESSTRHLFTLDLSLELDLTSSTATTSVMEICQLLLAKPERQVRDWEFAEDKGALHVQRLVDSVGLNVAAASESSAPQAYMDNLFQENRPLKMVVGQIGQIDSLQFVDSDLYSEGKLPRDHVEVKVMYSGLNFVDVMTVLGEVPPQALGGEMGGVITAVGSDVKDWKLGDMVVGACEGGFQTLVHAKHTMVNRVPSTMAIEEAVGISIAYSTAWMCLVNKAKIQKGESILIHSGAGGVGQSAIQICQHFGLEVFVTVGSTAKKELLINRYDIPEDHIFSSRDLSFVQGVKRMTNNRGIDVVLNSLAGELLRQSWHLVAAWGRFIEIGKRDILSNTGLDMEPFLRNAAFIGFDLSRYIETAPEFVDYEKARRDIFALLEAGKLRSIYPVTTMNYSDMSKAFRSLQTGKVMGKIVLKSNSDDIVPVVPRVKHTLTLDENGTYLLAGGLGGIGKSIATQLLREGAKNLAFISKSGDSKGESKTFLQQLRDHGCEARAYACDISDRDELAKVIAQCGTEMPPIRGLIQCAMTLRDGIFENMSYDDWVNCTRPKIQGSWNLHLLLPPNLDFFIMLSSVSGFIGNPGQANYAAGNVFEDSLAQYRNRKGLKATALDLAAVLDVGYLVETEDLRYRNMSHIQTLTVCEDEIHFLVKKAMIGYSTGDDPMPAQVVTGIVGANIDQAFVQSNGWARDGKLSITWKDAGSTNKVAAGLDKEALLKATSIESAALIVENIMIKRVAAAVMIPEEDMNAAEPLEAYGVNSLVAVEIKSWFSKEFHAELTVTEIGQSAISALALQVVKTSKLLTGRFKEQGEISKTDVAQVAEAPDVAEATVVEEVAELLELTKISPAAPSVEVLAIAKIAETVQVAVTEIAES